MADGFAVDIPDSGDPAGAWVNMGYFDTRAQAIAWVAETFGGDVDGRIGLVSELPDDLEGGDE